MIKHEMMIDQNSPLNKCEGGEPVLVISASNQAAPKVLYMIAAVYSLEGYPQECIDNLEQDTRDFMDWQNKNPGKIKFPD